MMRLLFLALALHLCFACGLHFARADEPTELLQRAIKATAESEDRLGRLNCFRTLADGAIASPAGSQKAKRVISMQAPSAFRMDTELDLPGGKGRVTITLNDGKGWLQVSGSPAKPMEAEEAAEMENDLVYAYRLATLLPLKQKQVKLSPVAEVDFKGKKLQGFKVTMEKRPDMLMYFGADNLLALQVFQGKEAGAKIMKQIAYTKYVAFNGIRIATEETLTQAGKESASWKVTDVKWLDKLEPEMLRP